MNPDESPASGIAVVVGPGHVEGLTADNGIAKLTINPDANTKKLTVTVSIHNICSFLCFYFIYCCY